MRDKVDLVIIICGTALIAFVLGVAFRHAIRDRGIDDVMAGTITNAVTAGILEAQVPLTCKDAAIIEVVRSLAEQGAHVKQFTLGVTMDDKLKSEDINDGN